MTSDDDRGFLSRWSQRKARVRRGKADTGPAPAAPAGDTPPLADPAPRRADASTVPVAMPAAPVATGASTPTAVPATADPAPEPPPTLDDVEDLTPQSDFARFVRADVDTPVRNAALKKLFTDPHYNVMDGLDIYIDDYNRPSPLPPGMLRRMVQTRFLGLFSEDRADDAPAVDPLAASGRSPDEDPDLQLQPDDVARRAGAEPDAATGAELDPGPGDDRAA